MTMLRKAATLAGLSLGALTISAAPAAAQSATAALVAPVPAHETTPPAGPRLAPRWEPARVLLPGQSEGREVNAAARNSVTIPVVTLLLGIIILILLVG